MSSILNALKKAEKQKTSPQNGQPPWAPADKIRKATEKKRRHGKIRKRLWVGIAALLILLCVAGWEMYSINRNNAKADLMVAETPTPPKASQIGDNSSPQKSARIQVPPESPKKIDQPVEKRLKRAVIKTPPEAGKTTSSKKNAWNVSTAKPSTSGAPPKVIPSEPRVSKTPSKAIPSKPRASKTPPGVVVSKPGKSAGQDSVSEPEPDSGDIAELKDPNVKLQALMWSKNPDKRMIVIKGDILHEGDTFGKYQIVRIDKSAVRVREGETLWKVPFASD